MGGQSLAAPVDAIAYDAGTQGYWLGAILGGEGVRDDFCVRVLDGEGLDVHDIDGEAGCLGHSDPRLDIGRACGGHNDFQRRFFVPFLQLVGDTRLNGLKIQAHFVDRERDVLIRFHSDLFFEFEFIAGIANRENATDGCP
jgi:hypothetical protein